MGGGNRRPYCKKCYRIRHKEWREKNTERIRESWRNASRKHHTYEIRRDKTLKGYNLTQEEYVAMEEAQDGRCAICQKKAKLVIDHCHVSGVVRGLLCNKCNTSLGAFGDNIKGLQRALNYLNSSIL